MYHTVDMSDTPYAGSLQHLDHSDRTAREQRGKYKANKRAPRGLYSRGYKRNTPATPRAGTVLVVKPSTMDYDTRLTKHGSVGVDYNED